MLSNLDRSAGRAPSSSYELGRARRAEPSTSLWKRPRTARGLSASTRGEGEGGSPGARGKGTGTGAVPCPTPTAEPPPRRGASPSGDGDGLSLPFAPTPTRGAYRPPWVLLLRSATRTGDAPSGLAVRGRSTGGGAPLVESRLWRGRCVGRRGASPIRIASLRGGEPEPEPEPEPEADPDPDAEADWAADADAAGRNASSSASGARPARRRSARLCALGLAGGPRAR